MPDSRASRVRDRAAASVAPVSSDLRGPGAAIEAELEQQRPQPRLLFGRERAECAADGPAVAVAEDLAGEHREPHRLPGEAEPDSSGEVCVDVTAEGQPAAAFGEVDEVALGADQAPSGIDEQERAAAQADARVPPPLHSLRSLEFGLGLIPHGPSP